MSSIVVEDLDLIRSFKALSCEWLETNGTGGYASSSILNCHTRKYHGLLAANLNQPSGRYVLLSKVEDSLIKEKKEVFLVSHQYPDYFFAGGQPFLKRFELDAWPKFFYQIGTTSVEKEVLMIRGMDGVILRYRFDRPAAYDTLRIKPFLAYRGIHCLSKENPYLRAEIQEIPGGYMMAPYEGMPSLHIQASVPSQFMASGIWYNGFQYVEDKARGYDFHEDLFCPGILEIPLDRKKEIYISFSMDQFSETLKKVWMKEQKKRLVQKEKNERVVETFKEEKDHVRNLFRAADQLLIRTPTGRRAILAGYHWFYEWGRDTLISLPGLTFCRGCLHEGEDILKIFGDFEKNGLFPNFFAEDERENAYNTIDASLWYFWAVQQYLKYGGDISWVRRYAWPVMKRILKQFMGGTIYDIHMDDRGLLHAGSEGTRLTWMDAAVDGHPATPRWGYMVEINALWYNAISFAHDLARQFSDEEFALGDLIALTGQSFRDTFQMESNPSLADVCRSGMRDWSVRPNQIFAVSLPYSPLYIADWSGVVETVARFLLTPCGIRTLSPGDAAYRGRYEGTMPERDAAYHQGTVWPWLMGHYGEAYLKANGYSIKARMSLRKWVRAFLKRHLVEAGLGSISEVFDGDTPQRADGCISQAWSTAELIRLLTLLRDGS
ncbi:MAG: glycogen debranching enzyme family protein [Syntrophaceae bacterium]|nr:glycogen debranching enzyme family protein [Syntrophaceae bacterium]